MGRLRKKPWADEYLKNSKIAFVNPINLKGLWNKEVFKNENCIWIEIGMGKGNFTIQQAMNNKNINMIGIDKYPSVQIVPVKKIEENIIDNLKFISGDAMNICDWFNNESIDKIFINFPDPWPKSKHEKRRLLHSNFLNEFYKILKHNSKIEFKTDQLDLFEFALEEVNSKTKFKIKNEIRDLHKNKSDVIMTEYEKKFSSLGKIIYYVELYKE
ncbi:MAG: tRNA (guanine-N(7)-)-methyltransferase [Candidatus Tyloplasma litorale]|nr:MAG: tRNA (guanine-N(7)-)-methyltransferase [Mycoplasmatales bacterium]